MAFGSVSSLMAAKRPKRCAPERASGIGLECAGTAYRHGNTRHRPNKRPFLAGFERVIEAAPVLPHSRKGPIRQLHGTTRGGRAGPVSEFTRRDLARGRFRLSSGLAGMNAAGQLSCPAQSLGGGVSVCNGPKDCAPPGRRGGKAHRNRTANRTVGREIQSPDRPRLFRFRLRCRDGNAFNGALSRGLGRIGAAQRADRGAAPIPEPLRIACAGKRPNSSTNKKGVSETC